MEFTHNREIHSILKDFNPVTKICKQDTWSVHTCGRKKLASPRLIKLRKDFRPLQVPRGKIVYGAGNRLTTRLDRRDGGNREGKKAESNAPVVPMMYASKYAREALRSNLHKLVAGSERRKQFCFNGGRHLGDAEGGVSHMGVLTAEVASLMKSQTSAASETVAYSDTASHIKGRETSPLITQSESNGLTTTGDTKTFITATTEKGEDANANPNPNPTPAQKRLFPPLNGARNVICDTGNGSPSTFLNSAMFSPATTPTVSPNVGRYTVPSNIKADYEELPPLQPITAAQVMETGLVGYPECAPQGRFDIKTREIFECASEKPILRYERQTHPEEDQELRGGGSFREFRRAYENNVTDYFTRSNAELQRYEKESRELFQQKYVTLVSRLENMKSASLAVGSMQNDIRNQHKREWDLRRKDVHQQWVIEFMELIHEFPRSSGIVEILRFLDDYITKEAPANDRGLTARQFDGLVAKLPRSTLLLTEVISVLYAMRHVFKISTEQFVDVMRERLRPLFPKRKDESLFDREYKMFQVIRREKAPSKELPRLQRDSIVASGDFRNIVSKVYDGNPAIDSEAPCPVLWDKGGGGGGGARRASVMSQGSRMAALTPKQSVRQRKRLAGTSAEESNGVSFEEDREME